MCLHRSYVVTEDLKVLSHPLSDHHTAIRKEHRIRDDYHEAEFDCASVEYRPIRDLFDLSTWDFHIDEKVKPKWWTAEHEVKTQKSLEKDFLRYTQLDSTYIFPANLDLSSLQELKQGCTIIAGGCIYLGSLRVIPPDVTLIAKRGGISLEGVRDCWHGVTIVAPDVRVVDRSVLHRANVSLQRGYRHQDPDFDYRNIQSLSPYSSASQQFLGHHSYTGSPFNP